MQVPSIKSTKVLEVVIGRCEEIKINEMKLCKDATNNHLVHLIKKISNVKECQVFLDLLTHFLYTSINNTSLNCFKGMIPIP
jgi:hypothetical protein